LFSQKDEQNLLGAISKEEVCRKGSVSWYPHDDENHTTTIESLFPEKNEIFLEFVMPKKITIRDP